MTLPPLASSLWWHVQNCIVQDTKDSALQHTKSVGHEQNQEMDKNSDHGTEHFHFKQFFRQKIKYGKPWSIFGKK